MERVAAARSAAEIELGRATAEVSVLSGDKALLEEKLAGTSVRLAEAQVRGWAMGAGKPVNLTTAPRSFTPHNHPLPLMITSPQALNYIRADSVKRPARATLLGA